MKKRSEYIQEIINRMEELREPIHASDLTGASAAILKEIYERTSMLVFNQRKFFDRQSLEIEAVQELIKEKCHVLKDVDGKPIKKMEEGSKEWEKAAVKVAFIYVDICSCRNCGYPRQKGYICQRCGKE